MSTRRSAAIKEWFRFNINETWLSFHRIIVGGLVAFSLIIVQAFISTKIEDAAEWISVVSIAIAIPILVVFVFLYSTNPLPIQATTFAGMLYFGGVFIDICGLDAAFWHVSRIAGLLFMVSGSLAFVVNAYNIEEAMKKRRQTVMRNQPSQPPPNT
jgi:hypothetical protein